MFELIIWAVLALVISVAGVFAVFYPPGDDQERFDRMDDGIDKRGDWYD